MEEKSSWQRRAEWYERRNHELTRSLLRIKKILLKDLSNPYSQIITIIDELNLESGIKDGTPP